MPPLALSVDLLADVEEDDDEDIERRGCHPGRVVPLFFLINQRITRLKKENRRLKLVNYLLVDRNLENPRNLKEEPHVNVEHRLLLNYRSRLIAYPVLRF